MGRGLELAGISATHVHDEQSLFANLGHRPDLVIVESGRLSHHLAALRRRLDLEKTTEALPLMIFSSEPTCAYGCISILSDAQPEEIFLVVRATLRRERPTTLLGTRNVAGLRLDEASFTLSFGDRTAALSKSEHCLLGPFFDAPGLTFDRLTLERLALNSEHFRDGNRLIDSYLSRMRRRLKSAIGLDPVRPVRGTGYVLNV